jgi:hypothetical protein
MHFSVEDQWLNWRGSPTACCAVKCAVGCCNAVSRAQVGPRATPIKWRNRHDACLRADRGALTQMDRPSFKAAQHGAARGHRPSACFAMKRAAFIRPASRAVRLVKATSLHFATQHGWRTF